MAGRKSSNEGQIGFKKFLINSMKSGKISIKPRNSSERVVFKFNAAGKEYTLELALNPRD